MNEPMIFTLEKYDKLVLVCCPDGCHATPVPAGLMKRAKRFTHARVAEVTGGVKFHFFNQANPQDV